MGRPETVSDREILQLFMDSSEPILTTTEVADVLGFTNSGARKRLYQLADDGYLDFKKVGNSPAWWLTEEGREHIDDI